MQRAEEDLLVLLDELEAEGGWTDREIRLHPNPRLDVEVVCRHPPNSPTAYDRIAFDVTIDDLQDSLTLWMRSGDFKAMHVVVLSIGIDGAPYRELNHGDLTVHDISPLSEQRDFWIAGDRTPCDSRTVFVSTSSDFVRMLPVEEIMRQDPLRIEMRVGHGHAARLLGYVQGYLTAGVIQRRELSLAETIRFLEGKKWCAKRRGWAPRSSEEVTRIMGCPRVWDFIEQQRT